MASAISERNGRLDVSSVTCQRSFRRIGPRLQIYAGLESHSRILLSMLLAISVPSMPGHDRYMRMAIQIVDTTATEEILSLHTSETGQCSTIQ